MVKANNRPAIQSEVTIVAGPPGSTGCPDSAGWSLHFHSGRADADIEVEHESAARRAAQLGLQ